MDGEGLVTEGVLRKSHAGLPYRKSNHLRFFVTEGFTIIYYADSSLSSKATVKGHFDLRNVVSLAPADDADEGAVEIHIWQGNKKPNKRITISFSAEPSTRDAWLRHWVSAVKADYVDASLLTYREAWLANELDSQYGDSSAISPRRALLSKQPSTTKVLTPRVPPEEQPEDELTEADTRERALARGKSAAPRQFAQLRVGAGAIPTDESETGSSSVSASAPAMAPAATAPAASAPAVMAPAATAPTTTASGRRPSLPKQPSSKAVALALNSHANDSAQSTPPVTPRASEPLPQMAEQQSTDLSEPVSRSARMRHAKCEALAAAFLAAEQRNMVAMVPTGMGQA